MYTNAHSALKLYTMRAAREMTPTPIDRPKQTSPPSPSPLPSPPIPIPPLRRTIRLGLGLLLQHLRVLVHARHQAHADRAPDRPRHLALVHVPQARLPRMLDAAHLRAELLDHGEILPEAQ